MNISKSSFFFFLFGFSIFISSILGACAKKATSPIPTQIFTPSATIKSSSPTLPISIIPNFSSTQTISSETKNSIIATVDARATKERSILPDCVIINRSYSPDGRWLAFECNASGIGIYNLEDNSKVWRLSYDEVFGLKYGVSNSFGRLIPKHWSIDGKYLYFTPFEGGDGGCVIYNEGKALFRINLLSGEFFEIIAPSQDFSNYNFSFSTDDIYLGLIETWREHPILKLHNLISDTQQEILLGEQYSGAGYVIWSPDNSYIFFSARSGNECDKMTYYLILMSMRSREQKIIMEGVRDETYQPIQWNDQNHVIMAEWFSEIFYDLDLTTGNIVPYSQTEESSNP